MMRCYVGLVSLAFAGLAAPANAQSSSGTFSDVPPAPPEPAAPATTVAPAPPAAPTTEATSPSTPAPPAAPAPVTTAALPVAGPPPPPPRDTDARPIRARRPFFIGGELGWNGLAGLGVNFSYHPVPRLAFDTGLGISLTGGRIGIRARYNFLEGEWTPFLAAGMSYAGGTGDQHPELEVKSEKIKIDVLPSPFLQLAGGVNYTGTEGFVFMATTGYSILLDRPNTRFVEDAEHPRTPAKLDAYNEAKLIYRGGVIVSVAFGYAF